METELLALIKERIVRYLQSGRADPSLIFGEDVTQAAPELWRSAVQESTGSVPVDVVENIARLHWLRYQALPTGEERDDLQVATVMFAHIFKVEPESVPGQLVEVVANDGAAMEMEGNFGIPAWWAVQIDYPGALSPGVRTASGWQIREASAILRRATKDDSSADLDRAISLLQSAVGALSHDHVKRVDALAGLSDAYELRFVRAGNPADQNEAVGIAQTAAAEYPTSPATLSRLGIKLSNRGRRNGDLTDLEAAIAAFRAALDNASAEDPKYASLLGNLADSLANKFDCTENLPDLDAAIEAYQAAADAAPNDYPQRAEILARLSRARTERAFRLGVSLEEQGNVEGAKNAYQQAIDSGDEEVAPRAAVNFGILLFDQGNMQGARAAYQRAIDSGHTDAAPRAAFILGTMLQEQGDIEGAKAACRQAISSGHPDMTPRAAVKLGNLLAGQGDVVGAKDAYRQAISSGHPDAAPRAAFNLGTLLDEQGEVAGARAAYQQAIDSRHRDHAPSAAFNLGTMLAERGEVAGARAAYQQAIDSRHRDHAPSAAFNLGNLLAKQGEVAGARAAYQQAIDSRHPDAAPAAAANLEMLLKKSTG